MSRFVLSLSIILLILTSCSDNVVNSSEDSDSKDSTFNEVAILVRNKCDTSFGLKLFWHNDSISNIDIEANSEVSIQRNEELNDTPFDSIVIFNQSYTESYKTHSKPKLISEGNDLVWNLIMPTVATKPINSKTSQPNIFNASGSWIGLISNGLSGGGTNPFYSHNNFSSVTINENKTLFDISIIASKNGVIYGHRGGYNGSELIKSTDQGSSWERVYSGYGGYFTPEPTIIDEHNIWLYSYHNQPYPIDSMYSCVYKTDGNGNVEKLATFDNFCVKKGAFADENNGYILANSSGNVTPSDNDDIYVFKTRDGGKRWSEPIKVSSEYEGMDIKVLSSETIIVLPRLNTYGTQNFYYYSEDAGESWYIIDLPFDKKLRSLSFVNSQTGFAKTGNSQLWSETNFGEVYRTDNGGKSWINLTSISLPGSRICFLSETEGYMTDLDYGQGSILLVTKDSGVTWQDLLYPYSYITE